MDRLELSALDEPLDRARMNVQQLGSLVRGQERGRGAGPDLGGHMIEVGYGRVRQRWQAGSTCFLLGRRGME
jgi:hypothetical protein